jgi:hypothetical protein
MAGVSGRQQSVNIRVGCITDVSQTLVIHPHGELTSKLNFMEAGSNTSTVALRDVGGDKREVSNLRQ